VDDAGELEAGSLDALVASLQHQQRAYDASRKSGRSQYLPLVRQLETSRGGSSAGIGPGLSGVPRVRVSLRELEQ